MSKRKGDEIDRESSKRERRDDPLPAPPPRPDTFPHPPPPLHRFPPPLSGRVQINPPDPNTITTFPPREWFPPYAPYNDVGQLALERDSRFELNPADSFVYEQEEFKRPARTPVFLPYTDRYIGDYSTPPYAEVSPDLFLPPTDPLHERAMNPDSLDPRFERKVSVRVRDRADTLERKDIYDAYGDVVDWKTQRRRNYLVQRGDQFVQLPEHTLAPISEPYVLGSDGRPRNLYPRELSWVSQNPDTDEVPTEHYRSVPPNQVPPPTSPMTFRQIRARETGHLAPPVRRYLGDVPPLLRSRHH